MNVTLGGPRTVSRGAALGEAPGDSLAVPPAAEAVGADCGAAGGATGDEATGFGFGPTTGPAAVGPGEPGRAVALVRAGAGEMAESRGAEATGRGAGARAATGGWLVRGTTTAKRTESPMAGLRRALRTAQVA